MPARSNTDHPSSFCSLRECISLFPEMRRAAMSFAAEGGHRGGASFRVTELHRREISDRELVDLHQLLFARSGSRRNDLRRIAIALLHLLDFLPAHRSA